MKRKDFIIKSGLASAAIITPYGFKANPLSYFTKNNTLHIGIIGLCTPPVGTILFVGSGVANISVSQVVKPLLPFLAIMIFVLLSILYIPEITMILPRLFGL